MCCCVGLWMASGLRMWAGLSEGFVGTEDIEDRLVVGSPGSSLVLLCRFGMAPPYFWG
jgi:hypothetical protein